MKKLSGHVRCVVMSVSLFAAGSGYADHIPPPRPPESLPRIVKVSFSGIYDTATNPETNQPRPVFGLSGTAVPYNYYIVFDTGLDTDTRYYPTNWWIGPEPTAHELHAYSASSIIATSLTFGSQTWTAANLETEIWFDTDISRSAPTLTSMAFAGGSPGGSLTLGRSLQMEPHSWNPWGFSSRSDILDFGSGNSTFAYSDLLAITAAVTSVPESTTSLMLAVGLLALAGCKLSHRN